MPWHFENDQLKTQTTKPKPKPPTQKPQTITIIIDISEVAVHIFCSIILKLLTTLFYCHLLRFFSMFIGRVPFLCVFDVEFLKAITIKEFSNFTNRRNTTDAEGESVNSNIFNAHDDHWKNIRAFLTPTFTSGKLKVVSNFRWSLKCYQRSIDLES